MIKLSTYITELNFEYAISYSGLRGKVFENLEAENNKRIKDINEPNQTPQHRHKPLPKKNSPPPNAHSLPDFSNVQQRCSLFGEDWKRDGFWAYGHRGGGASACRDWRKLHHWARHYDWWSVAGV